MKIWFLQKKKWYLCVWKLNVYKKIVLMELKPLENERWIWAKTFNGEYPNYLVSDKGRCWNCKTEQFVGNWYRDHWYVHLSKSKKESESIMIGRLALISFDIPIPKHLQGLPTSKLQAMHLDGNSTNNNLYNFAWGDNKENHNEINARIRKSEVMRGKNVGKEHPNSKSIIQYTKDGEFIRYWDSAADVERELGIWNTNISKCCRGKLKSAGGYVWKYKE